MFFILRDTERLSNCLEYIQSVSGGVKPVSVEVKEYRKNRSQAQNRTMWMWYKDISDYTGYTPEELHDMAKVKFLGTTTRTLPAMFGGEETTIVEPKSTTDLDTQGMAEFLSKIEMFALSMGVCLRYPDDYRYAMNEE